MINFRIKYRKYPIRNERYYGIFYTWNNIQPTLDIYTGRTAYVFFVRRDR